MNSKARSGVWRCSGEWLSSAPTLKPLPSAIPAALQSFHARAQSWLGGCSGPSTAGQPLRGPAVRVTSAHVAIFMRTIYTASKFMYDVV